MLINHDKLANPDIRRAGCEELAGAIIMQIDTIPSFLALGIGEHAGAPHCHVDDATVVGCPQGALAQDVDARVLLHH